MKPVAYHRLTMGIYSTILGSPQAFKQVFAGTAGIHPPQYQRVQVLETQKYSNKNTLAPQHPYPFEAGVCHVNGKPPKWQKFGYRYYLHPFKKDIALRL